MEKMPYRPELEVRISNVPTSMPQSSVAHEVTTDWRQSLPVMVGRQVVLRELRASDAASLCALLNTEEVARFISPPPTTVEGFERFIAWTLTQRASGTYASFAVTIQGCDTAIGIFQIREMERGFGTAEWGFAIGSSFWGTGVFQDAAERMLEFAFTTLGVHRLEARAAVMNSRGIGALRKIGAVKEGILRKSLERNGQFLDQALYAILESDWRGSRSSMIVIKPVQMH
jgi:ribosomal-protein-alanine N-acetyltransferase